MKGQAPYQIEFRWVYRPPIPFGLEPEARQALIQERLAEIFDDIDRASRGEETPVSTPTRGAIAGHGNGGRGIRPTRDGEYAR